MISKETHILAIILAVGELEFKKNALVNEYYLIITLRLKDSGKFIKKTSQISRIRRRTECGCYRYDDFTAQGHLSDILKRTFLKCLYAIIRV